MSGFLIDGAVLTAGCRVKEQVSTTFLLFAETCRDVSLEREIY
jgi:hypothetical protein